MNRRTDRKLVLFQDPFDLTGLFLDLSGELIGFAFLMQTAITREVAGCLFESAFHFSGGSFGLVSTAMSWFHNTFYGSVLSTPIRGPAESRFSIRAP